MITSKENKNGKIEIDLTGPQGNAFVLMGIATNLAKQLGLDSKLIQKEMMAGDYENLLSVMEEHFGDHIVMYY
jgi:hypothetical protein